jgi:hypothetical protein
MCIVRRKEHLGMKILSFLVAVTVFAVVWVLTTVLLAFAARAVLPGVDGHIPVLGVHWASLPGSALGVIAGYRVFYLLRGGWQRRVPK